MSDELPIVPASKRAVILSDYEREFLRILNRNRVRPDMTFSLSDVAMIKLMIDRGMIESNNVAIYLTPKGLAEIKP